MAKEKDTAVSVTMHADKKCKSCVRYRGDGPQAEAVGSSFYLQNEAYEKLGKPDKIMITITAA